MATRRRIVVYESDIDADYEITVVGSGTVAWDIETTGLDCHHDRVALCQLSPPVGPIAIARIGSQVPQRLCSILSNPSIKKVFHNAMFDLQFMRHHWGVTPTNVACTRVAAKLLEPKREPNYSLKSLLRQYLNISISKDQQNSNWVAQQLTDEQISYAAEDAAYLLPLLDELCRRLHEKGLLALAERCFEHIPTRVELELLGYDDVFGLPRKTVASVPSPGIFRG